MARGGRAAHRCPSRGGPRLGFRMMRIDRDLFTPEAGYPSDLFIDDVRLLDRAWLEITW